MQNELLGANWFTICLALWGYFESMKMEAKQLQSGVAAVLNC